MVGGGGGCVVLTWSVALGRAKGASESLHESIAGFNDLLVRREGHVVRSNSWRMFPLARWTA